MSEAKLQDLLNISEAIPKSKRFSNHSTTSEYYIYFIIYIK